VRCAALRYSLLVSEPAASYGGARAAARDDDANVRRIAIEHLQQVKTVAATELVRELIDGNEFASRDFGEKKRTFLAYAALAGPASAPLFRDRLAKRNLLVRGDVDEQRAAAAAALGYLRDEDSRPTLAKLATAVLTRAIVKHECEQALAMLDAPPASAPPAPAAPSAPSRPASAPPAPSAAAPAPRSDPANPATGAVRVPIPTSLARRVVPTQGGPPPGRFAATPQPTSPLDDDSVIDRPAAVRVDLTLRRTVQAAPPPAPAPVAPAAAPAPAAPAPAQPKPRSTVENLVLDYLEKKGDK
jgi:hypothetical protein